MPLHPLLSDILVRPESYELLNQYYVDSGGFALLPSAALKQWDSDFDSSVLETQMRHKPTGRIIVQSYGTDSAPADAVRFFHWDAVLAEFGASPNDMLSAGVLEEIKNPPVHGFSYTAYCSCTNSSDEGVLAEGDDGIKAFYSKTSHGDGIYGVYKHSSGAILIDTDNRIDIALDRQQRRVALDEDTVSSIKSLQNREIGVLPAQGVSLTLIDPSGLPSQAGGLDLPLGHYEIHIIEDTANRDAMAGYLLIPVSG